MSSIDPAFVQIVAEGLGIKPTDDALKSLAPDVEYRLREIVQVSGHDSLYHHSLACWPPHSK